MSALDLVLGKLTGHRKTSDHQYEARCPAHEDKRASLSVGVGQEGKVLLRCHAGCDVADVLRELELRAADLFPEKTSARRVVETVFQYTDEHGKYLFEIVKRVPGKKSPKDFLQRHRGPDGQLVWKKNPRQVMYRLPELLEVGRAGGEVWVVEGEKDADALRSRGLTATTSPGGADAKWLPEYTDAFSGVGVVNIIPDNDEPGRKHAAKVEAALRGVVPVVKVVALYGPVKDVSDWLGTAGGTVERLKQLAGAVPQPEAGSFEALRTQALADVVAGSKSTTAGALAAPAFELASALLDRDFPKTPWLVRGLLVEKAVSAVAGEPKTAKTWSALEIALSIASGTSAFGQFVTGPPRTVAVFLVEDDARSTRNRLRALAAGRGLDAAGALGRIAVKCRGQLDLQSDEQLAWLVASCRSLPELPALLVLDPLRDIHAAKEDKSDEMAPVMARLRLLRELLGCAVLFVHHASKAGEATNARRPGQRMRGSGAVHAAVDGGLYLSNLETDGSNRFESVADVELKAVAGAGQFSLRLDVLDDESGEAIEAKWTVIKGEAKSVGAGDNLDKAQAEIIKVLKAEWLFSSSSPKPIATRMLRVKTKVRMESIGAALAQLQAEQKVVQVLNGKKALGWAYRPTADEIPTSQRSDSQRYPSDPEPLNPERFPPLYGEPLKGNGASGVSAIPDTDPDVRTPNDEAHP